MRHKQLFWINFSENHLNIHSIIAGILLKVLIDPKTISF
jgi:hypothetical protein